jgi:hypothetical protein
MTSRCSAGKRLTTIAPIKPNNAIVKYPPKRERSIFVMKPRILVPPNIIAQTAKVENMEAPVYTMKIGDRVTPFRKE